MTTRVTDSQLRAAVVRLALADRRAENLRVRFMQHKIDVNVYMRGFERWKASERALLRLGTKLLGKGKT